MPADRARLRRVLRQSLSPQRRGGAGEPRLSQGLRISELPRQFRAAGRHEMHRDRDRDGRRRPEVRGLGKQKCEDTGPLTKKRMETVDEEFLNASIDFIDRANKDKRPFFVWFNSTRMHISTHLKPESQGKTGLGLGRQRSQTRRSGRPPFRRRGMRILAVFALRRRFSCNAAVVGRGDVADSRRDTPPSRAAQCVG